MDITLVTEISKLFIPVIALTGVYIAYQQHSISREKIRYDLFEKRFKIYEAINKVVISLSWQNTELEQADYIEFYQACNESEFLLPDAAFLYIKEIRDAVGEQKIIKNQLSRKNIEEIKLKELYGKEDMIIEKFNIYQKELSSIFKPFLKITKI